MNLISFVFYQTVYHHVHAGLQSLLTLPPPRPPPPCLKTLLTPPPPPPPHMQK